MAQGVPVLLALAYYNGETPIATHFVVAAGVSSGAILVQDPIPALQRGSLDEYLSGTSINNVSLVPKLAGALRLNSQSSSSLGMLVVGAGNPCPKSPR